MLLDLPPELLDAIFCSSDDKSQRALVATCHALRRRWLPEAWRTLTFTGRHVKTQLNTFVAWLSDVHMKDHRLISVPPTANTQNLFIRACLLQDDGVSPESEGKDNTDIIDEDISDLLPWLADSLKVLSIDLPPTPDHCLFDITLNCISRLHKLERLFLGRVKVNDGYEIVCEYTSLKEAVMIWCHGIVEQRLLIDQPNLQYLDVHDSWDIGNLSAVSHQWQNLKSFRFSAIDNAYALGILEMGRGVMTSLEEVSFEVPMSEGVFFEIVSQLSAYPIRRFHLAMSAEGLQVFVTPPGGPNTLPDEFGPKWLSYIAHCLKCLEELVLDYREGGNYLQLEWPGDQSAYATALSKAQHLHTLAIAIYALPQYGWDDCAEYARTYFGHIPSLQTLHFTARPIFEYEILCHASDSPMKDVPESCFRGYTMHKPPGNVHHGDTYRPFWITRGPDVAVDRHRRQGGLSIVSNDSDVESMHWEELMFDGSHHDGSHHDGSHHDGSHHDGSHHDHNSDFFEQDDEDLELWFPGFWGTEDSWSSDGDSGSGEDGQIDELDDPPPPTSEEWMEGLAAGMSNIGFRVGQLDFSALDGHSTDSEDDGLDDLDAESDLSID